MIIGAGAAGLSAGYLLTQNNVDYEILEATARHVAARAARDAVRLILE